MVGDEKEVIRVGVFYLQIISITFPLCVSLYLLTNFLRGAGEIIYPLFNTLLELSFRTISAFCFGSLFRIYWSVIMQTVEFYCEYDKSFAEIYLRKVATALHKDG